MPESGENRSPEQVLARSAWLAGFTKKLVRDADLAEDVGQDAMVASLSSSDPRGPSRPWLARVARNIAISLARRQKRRRQAEQAAHSEATAPETAELVAELELQRLAVQALSTLHEPYRTALLYRFMKGLSARESAKRLDVPLETMRARIKRGLALLRARLDRDHRGRRGWLAPLGIPSIWRQSTPALWGIVLMKMKTKVVIAAGLLLAGLLGIWQVTRPEASLSDIPRQDAEGMVARIADPEEATGLPETREPLSPEPVAPSDNATASLLVRVIWHDTGEPAEHVGLRIARDVYISSRIASTGPDGTCFFEGLEPGSFRVTVDRPTGNRYGSHEVELAAGEQGILELEAGGDMDARGIVVDPDGIPVPDAEVLVSNGGTWPQWTYPTTRTAGDGTFFLRSLGSLCVVGARAEGYGTSDFVLLQTAPRGAPGEAALRLVLPASLATLTGTVLDPEGRPVAGALVGIGAQVDSRTLPDGTTGQVPPQRLLRTDAQGRFSADFLRPGQQPIHVYGEGFTGWRQDVNCPPWQATDVTVRLQPGATLFGQITDKEGNPVKSVWIEVETSRYNAFQHNSGASDADGWYRFEDLPEGEVSITAGLAGQATLQLVAGQEMRRDMTLDPGLQIRGILVNESGKPLEGWWLRAEGGSGGAITDAEGRFVFSNCEDRPYTLRVFEGIDFRPVTMVLENVQPGVPERTFTVPDSVLPSATMVGRVLTPEGRPAAGVRIELRQGRFPISDTPETDTRGRFEIGPLPPGTYEVFGFSSGYVAADFADVTLLPNEVHQLPDGRLRYGALLELTVRGTDQQLDELDVEVLDADGRRLARGSLRGSRVDFHILPAGSHQLSIRGPNVNQQLLPIELKAQETLSLEIDLR